MENNDSDSRVPGTGPVHGMVGPEFNPTIEEQIRARFGYMNTGYRWLKVNNYLYVYTGTTLQDNSGSGRFSTPHTEVLAYVQRQGEENDFKAFTHIKFGGAVGMQIPHGPLVDMILKVEAYILESRMNKETPGVTPQGQ
ncbi:hypothetical protein [Dyadobacter diqingensis]|uniref:hypothetical protein n=1 Tax=Dyadobacter diqingensis TaxID=2938121 RepID=UPI0020C42202|nr:hypothetical protein [Dyadobacter diqingensis]